jgi:DNA primase
MRFPPHILDEIRARLPVSQVVGRKVALKKKGREFSGLSPFKVEKTPSFFVNDQKGFYHCFASGEHGDIFTFLMKTEGLSFPEAIERLAAEAGVALPKPNARGQEREDERQRLYNLLEASAKFFEQQLAGLPGREARAYIAKRGLATETERTFRLGYSPNSKHALRDHLAKAGFTADEMVLSGMLIGGDDIPVAYDRFRHRVMFPIQDGKGRVIAFGGRALDSDAPAKYVNSPETPLFHKGHVLFNAHRARPASHEKGRIIAVEGYMDAVSLAEAGIMETVAPLGTALTEDQLKLLWRLAAEPILCFDGDSAGRKAAFRAVDIALPHLKPGVSLTFAFLPDGLDPDDLVRQQGREGIEAVLGRAKPLVEVLFEREWGQGDWVTPERRARLEQQFRLLTSRIDDPSVRQHYERDIRQRLRAAWGPFSQGPTDAKAARHVGAAAPWSSRAPTRVGSGVVGRGRPQDTSRMPLAAQLRANGPTGSLRSSRLVAGDTSPPPREALLLMAAINHPWLAEEYAETLSRLELTHPALSRLRDGILSVQAIDNLLDSEGLRTQLTGLGLGKVLDLAERSLTHKCDKFSEPRTERAEVEAGWRHALALHERQVGLKRSLEAAERAWHEDHSEEAFLRIRELQGQLGELAGSGTDPAASDELQIG